MPNNATKNDRLLLEEPDSDEIVFDRARRELRGLETREAQFEQRFLPCTDLLSQQAFYNWRDGFDDWGGRVRDLAVERSLRLLTTGASTKPRRAESRASRDVAGSSAGPTCRLRVASTSRVRKAS